MGSVLMLFRYSLLPRAGLVCIPAFGSMAPPSIYAASVSGLTQPNSGSEEDPHHVVDERKQKRMLSNRESARRSRMRKQQHLDELRAQAAQLRAENNHILIKFNIASHHYFQLQEENSLLRTHAMQLTLKLRSLNIAMQWVGESTGLDLDANFLSAMDVKAWNLPSIPRPLPPTEIFQ